MGQQGMEPARFLRGPRVLGDGEAYVIDARALRQLTVITGAGCTATVSRVDTPDAGAHTTGAENAFTVAATTKTTTAVDWPFYRISAAGGSLRWATIGGGG